MAVGLLAVVWLAAGVSTAWGQPAATAEPRIEGCLVSLIDEVEVPAREPGVILQLAVRQGAVVAKGEVLARIDDDQPQMEKRRAQAEHDQAIAKAESDVDVRYSQKAQGVSEMAYRKAEQSHERVGGAVTEVERERLKLEWEKTGLQIEQAALERALAALAATSKGVEVEAAEKAIERREIRSPIDGEVEEVFPHEGEWVQPGDPLARVIRTDGSSSRATSTRPAGIPPMSAIGRSRSRPGWRATGRSRFRVGFSTSSPGWRAAATEWWPRWRTGNWMGSGCCGRGSS